LDEPRGRAELPPRLGRTRLVAATGRKLHAFVHTSPPIATGVVVSNTVVSKHRVQQALAVSTGTSGPKAAFYACANVRRSQCAYSSARAHVWKCVTERENQYGAIMTVRSLAAGIVALAAVLLIAGSLGGVGPVELSIWLGLVAVWIAWWKWSRRRNAAF
jgi:hypothetical protein